MNNTLTKKEREHLGRVKELPCSVCDAPGPSEAHHVEQRLQYTCIALCPDCHRGGHNGLHGRRAMWKIKHMAELDALNVTIERLMND
jgi:hypothetical protein